MNQSDCSGKTLKLWPVFVDHFTETYSLRGGEHFAVTSLPLPIDSPSIEVCLYSQKTLRHGKEKLWFLQKLKDICLHDNQEGSQLL
jgi:hypothetical protein